jgi:hypothetical protein
MKAPMMDLCQVITKVLSYAKIKERKQQKKKQKEENKITAECS